jgi:hypothetical protein
MGCGGSTLPNSPDARPTCSAGLDSSQPDKASINQRKEDLNDNHEVIIVQNRSPDLKPEIHIEEQSSDVTHKKMPENFHSNVVVSNSTGTLKIPFLSRDKYFNITKYSFHSKLVVM